VSAAEIITGSRVDVDERIATNDNDADDLSGWFAIATDPFPCPAEGCPFIARFMTASHLILVWPRDDDPDLLAQAVRARDAGRNPRIVEYEHSMGRAISWDLWNAQGCRVHAYGARPEGYPDRYERL
jgi:hypothetical protein